MSRAAHLLPLLLLLLSLTGLRAQTPPTETPSPLVTTPLDTVDATDGLTSLREAILHLNAGLIPDTILFALPLGSNRTVVLSANLPAVTAPRCYINGSNRGPDTGRVALDGGGTHSLLLFLGGHIAIDSLLFLNGRNGNPGGAVNAVGASLTLRDCLFRDNIALHSGGAVYCGTTAAGPPPRFTAIRCLFLDNHSLNGGAIVLENCDTSRITASRFSGNLVLTDGRDSHGGALRILSSPLLLDSCLFVGNKARVSDSDILAFVKCYGGALSAQQSSLSLRNTTFSHNLAEAPASGVAARAGGLHADQSDLLLHNCAFIDDTAVGDGGAIYIEGTASHSAVISRCSFSGCYALTALGGAVANYAAARLLIDHCTFFSNGSGMGGALYSRNGVLSLLNSTLVSNHAAENNGGGALMAQGGQLQLCNNLFADNTAVAALNDIASWPLATLRAYHNLWYSVTGTPAADLCNTVLAPTVPLPLHLDAYSRPAPAHTTLHSVTHTLLPPLPNTAAYHSGVPTALSPDRLTAAYLDGTAWRSLADNQPLAATLLRDSLDQIGTPRPADTLAVGAVQPLPALLLSDTLVACDSTTWRNSHSPNNDNYRI